MNMSEKHYWADQEMRWFREWEKASQQIEVMMNAMVEIDVRIKVLQSALEKIVAAQTPNANGTVLRMARIAEQALKNGGLK